MNTSEVTLLTVVFPENLKYWDALVESINSQNTNFDITIVLDGVDKKELGNFKLNKNIHYVRSSESPFKNRLNGIKFCKEAGFKKIVFQDSDDLLSDNRIQVISRELNHYSIVCNDLSIIDESGHLQAEYIWRKRLKGAEIITTKLLSDKNLIGFGNTGMCTDIDLSSINHDLILTAPDWYFFSVLSRDYTVAFTSEVQTYYRQHAANTIGLKELTEERLNKCFEVKIEHYSAMKSIDPSYERLYQEVLLLKDRFNKNRKKNTNYILPDSKENLFWWEESTLLQ